jgi:hypothetical protein
MEVSFKVAFMNSQLLFHNAKKQYGGLKSILEVVLASPRFSVMVPNYPW